MTTQIQQGISENMKIKVPDMCRVRQILDVFIRVCDKHLKEAEKGGISKLEREKIIQNYDNLKEKIRQILLDNVEEMSSEEKQKYKVYLQEKRRNSFESNDGYVSLEQQCERLEKKIQELGSRVAVLRKKESELIFTSPDVVLGNVDNEKKSSLEKNKSSGISDVNTQRQEHLEQLFSTFKNQLIVCKDLLKTIPSQKKKLQELLEVHKIQTTGGTVVVESSEKSLSNNSNNKRKRSGGGDSTSSSNKNIRNKKSKDKK